MVAAASGITFVERRPTLTEHRELAQSVGWDNHFDWETLPLSLHGSLHGVVAVQDGAVIGMGRLVGDGAHYFYVQDLIVRPEHREHGVGSTILDMLLAWIASTAPSRAFVGLFASDEAIPLYEEHGFERTGSTGMHLFVESGSGRV